MQKHISVGRLVADPEIKRFDSQGTKSKSKTRFSMAIESMRKDRNGNKIVTFIDYEVWDAQGENLVKYAKKGKELYVEGEFLRSDYKDKETQKKIYHWYVLVDKIQYLGGSQNQPTNNQATSNQPTSASNQQETTAPVENKPKKSDIDMELEELGFDMFDDDNDVPF